MDESLYIVEVDISIVGHTTKVRFYHGNQYITTLCISGYPVAKYIVNLVKRFLHHYLSDATRENTYFHIVDSRLYKDLKAAFEYCGYQEIKEYTEDSL